MYVTLPEATWVSVTKARWINGRHVCVGTWTSRFIHAHYNDTVYYPTALWLQRDGELVLREQGYPYAAGQAAPFIHHHVGVTPFSVALLKARSAQDGAPMSEVLRRLLRQYFGERPSMEDTERTTIGTVPPPPKNRYSREESAIACPSITADFAEWLIGAAL